MSWKNGGSQDQVILAFISDAGKHRIMGVVKARYKG